MIQRIIVLSTLLIAFAVTINWILEHREVVVPEAPGNEPDLYMLNATINQFDAGGKLAHQVSADRFTHFPLTNLTAMDRPILKLSSKHANKPWQIMSRSGRILPQSGYREEVLELWDNVRASHSGASGRFINIKTESLTAYPARDYLETDTKVYIDNESGRTTAAGMKADLAEGKFMFFSDETDRVMTIYLPKLAES